MNGLVRSGGSRRSGNCWMTPGECFLFAALTDNTHELERLLKEEDGSQSYLSEDKKSPNKGEGKQQHPLDVPVTMEWSPLHAASAMGHCGAVSYLIEKGATVNQLDRQGRTPLHYACHGGHHETVQLLLFKHAHLHIQDKQGSTPFHWACYSGSLEIVRMLFVIVVQTGSSVLTLRDGKNRTAVDIAKRMHQTEIVRILENGGTGVCVHPSESIPYAQDTNHRKKRKKSSMSSSSFSEEEEEENQELTRVRGSQNNFHTRQDAVFATSEDNTTRSNHAFQSPGQAEDLDSVNTNNHRSPNQTKRSNHRGGGSSSRSAHSDQDEKVNEARLEGNDKDVVQSSSQLAPMVPQKALPIVSQDPTMSGMQRQEQQHPSHLHALPAHVYSTIPPAGAAASMQDHQNPFLQLQQQQPLLSSSSSSSTIPVMTAAAIKSAGARKGASTAAAAAAAASTATTTTTTPSHETATTTTKNTGRKTSGNATNNTNTTSTVTPTTTASTEPDEYLRGEQIPSDGSSYVFTTKQTWHLPQNVGLAEFMKEFCRIKLKHDEDQQRQGKFKCQQHTTAFYDYALRAGKKLYCLRRLSNGKRPRVTQKDWHHHTFVQVKRHEANDVLKSPMGTILRLVQDGGNEDGELVRDGEFDDGDVSPVPNKMQQHESPQNVGQASSKKLLPLPSEPRSSPKEQLQQQFQKQQDRSSGPSLKKEKKQQQQQSFKKLRTGEPIFMQEHGAWQEKKTNTTPAGGGGAPHPPPPPHHHHHHQALLHATPHFGPLTGVPSAAVVAASGHHSQEQEAFSRGDGMGVGMMSTGGMEARNMMRRPQPRHACISSTSSSSPTPTPPPRAYPSYGDHQGSIASSIAGGGGHQFLPSQLNSSGYVPSLATPFQQRLSAEMGHRQELSPSSSAHMSVAMMTKDEIPMEQRRGMTKQQYNNSSRSHEANPNEMKMQQHDSYGMRQQQQQQPPGQEGTGEEEQAASADEPQSNGRKGLELLAFVVGDVQ